MNYEPKTQAAIDSIAEVIANPPVDLDEIDRAQLNGGRSEHLKADALNDLIEMTDAFCDAIERREPV